MTTTLLLQIGIGGLSLTMILAQGALRNLMHLGYMASLDWNFGISLTIFPSLISFLSTICGTMIATTVELLG